MTGANDEAWWSAPWWRAPVDPDHQRLLDRIFQDIEAEMKARGIMQPLIKEKR